MPGPSPDDYDSQDAFMHACVVHYVDEGKPNEQAVAICLSEYGEKSYDAETRALRAQLAAVKDGTDTIVTPGDEAIVADDEGPELYVAPHSIEGPSPDDYETEADFMADAVPFLVEQGSTEMEALDLGMAQWNEKRHDNETRSLRAQLKRAKFDESEERDYHGRWTSGGGGPQAVLAGGVFPIAVTPMHDPSDVHNIPGIGDVDQFIASHPQEPGERPYQYESRLVKGLPIETQNDVLFYTREQYPPVKYLADAAAQYRADHGLPEPKDDITQQQVDLTKANEVGRAFETMPDMSNDPRTQFAYDDFKAQTNEQWHLLTDPPSKGGLGVKVDFVHNAEPYPSAAAQADDLRANNHLSIATGLGGEHQASMTTEEYDQFRAVHDAFGHAAIGGGFDRHGEYQAWLGHESMYTGLGARAMSSEYHGVNSALWSGNPADKGGTGKTILLPDRLTDPPWDENGNLVRKGIGELLVKAAAMQTDDAEALKYFIGKLGLDSEWAHQFATPPWHPCDPNQDPAYAKKSACCDDCTETELKAQLIGSAGETVSAKEIDASLSQAGFPQASSTSEGYKVAIDGSTPVVTHEAPPQTTANVVGDMYPVENVAQREQDMLDRYHEHLLGHGYASERQSNQVAVNGKQKASKYDETQHPRDDHGRWSTDGGGGGDTKLEPGSGDGSSKDSPIKTKDVHTAALALRDGKYVELDQPNGTSTLLDEIDKMVKDAEDPKNEGKLYDLCKASVPGSNLNCDQAVVESRTGMPQLKGVPIPGSPADVLEKNDKGEVDLTDQFLQHLKYQGIGVSDASTPAENLRASQRELNGGKVAGMANAMIAGTMAPGDIWTTRDDYVLDGHHRWAATVGVEYKQGQSISIPSKQIDMSITDAIREANDFTEKMGIPHAAKGWSLAIAKAGATLSAKAEPAHSDTANPTKGKAMSSMKRGVYEITEFKSAPIETNPTGEFEALVSVFNNVDLQGDRVMPGAFKSWLQTAKQKGDPIPVVWSHQWDVPSSHIGVIDPAQMRETPDGLLVKGSLDIHGDDANPVAKQVHKLLMRRSVKGWSFAYDVHNEKRAKDGANELLDLSVIEVGPTLKGANPDAQTIGAKAIADGIAEYNAQMGVKAGRTISGATAAQLRQLYDKVEAAEAALEEAETMLEGLLGIPDDDAAESTENEPKSEGVVGMKADKYTAEQLRTMLDKGQAMRNANGDPAYPIADAEDLDNAIKAVGRGGASANAIRKYVMRRASAMSMTDKIPDTWNSDGSLKSAGYVDPFEDSTAAEGAESEIEAKAAKSDKPDVGEEPEAKLKSGEPDSETLELRRRIEEMRLT